MANTDSCSNSSVGSPYGSNTDLMDDDDEIYTPKSQRRMRGKKVVGGLDLDDIESTVRNSQQEASDLNSQLNATRNQSQSQTRRIHDLQLQFEEARVRIDKLLQRKPRTRSEFDMGMSSPLTSARRTSDSPKVSRTSSVSSTSSSHKTEISVNPMAASKLTFGTVTLTVKVDDE